MIAQAEEHGGTVRQDELWVARQLVKRERAGRLPARRGGYVMDDTGNVVYEPDELEIEEYRAVIRWLYADRVSRRAVLLPLKEACCAMFGVKDV